MNRFQEEYQRKLKSVEEAVSLIPDGAIIGLSYCASEPSTLLSNLHLLHQQGKKARVIEALTLGMYPYAQEPAYRDSFTVDSTFFMTPDRVSHKKKLTSHLPTHLHNVIDRCFSEQWPNVVLFSVSPMDSHGYVRCALSLMAELEFLARADLVIVEVNPNMPHVHGETEIHISQIDALVEVNTPLPQIPRGKVSELDRTIGEYIASLVNDGDTIQLGIGSIPDAAAQALMSKHDLGVHTEMITNSLVDLVEAGVVNGRKKTLHPGKIIGTFALGDQRLYDMMDDNPSIHLMRGCYVNDPFVVARNDNMVSINTCVSVDLTGQINSESLGSMQYSGSGGQNDTAFGANHAKNGRAIIAMHSTAKDGKVSTINAVLAPGAVVTLSRNNVDYIVTEYGIAPMRGRPVRDRVENLIAVAHPDFRAQLRKDAEKYLLW